MGEMILENIEISVAASTLNITKKERQHLAAYLAAYVREEISRRRGKKINQETILDALDAFESGAR